MINCEQFLLTGWQVLYIRLNMKQSTSCIYLLAFWTLSKNLKISYIWTTHAEQTVCQTLHPLTTYFKGLLLRSETLAYLQSYKAALEQISQCALKILCSLIMLPVRQSLPIAYMCLQLWASLLYQESSSAFCKELWTQE